MDATTTENAMAKQQKPQKQNKEGQAERQAPIAWRDDVPEDDYQSAVHFLTLTHEREHVEYKAIDLLRAAQLVVPKVDDLPTREQRRQIEDGEPLAPILLVRMPVLGKVIVADGFHRLCAAYRIDPDVHLHCKLAG
jgi:hypothetical protein